MSRPSGPAARATWWYRPDRKGSVMKLYYSPGACSLGIHVLMEEIGQPYELQRLNFPEGDQHKPEFQAVNRKGKVPTLVRDDGAVLTEFRPSPGGSRCPTRAASS